MGWNKDGHTIRANYLHDVEVVGIVKESRVKYGGKVQYAIELEFPVYVHSDEPRYHLLIDDDEVVADFGIIFQGV
jgi:hypothetical protein